ncbi:Non-catalytic module family DOC2, partial [Piromyces sp. E2]
CWSTQLGYNCCSDSNAEVVYTDDDGDWGVENGNWCGIQKCWSLPLGYPCCSSCIDVSYVDEDGNWGVENNNWCGLLKSC